MFEKITRLKYSKIGGDMTNVRRVREMWEEYENFFLYFLYRHISRIILVYPCDIPCTLITFLISSSHFLYPGRKMSPIFGDISPKYLVSMGIDTIFLAEISARWFFGINLEKSAIFLNISPGQRGVNGVNALQWKSMCYSVPATVHLPNNLLLLPRGFEPQTFWFGVQPSCQLG